MAQTPRRVLRERILAVLASTETGRMARADLLAQLQADFDGTWTAEDLIANRNQGLQEKWRINASFARKDMVDDGEILPDDTGYWGLTAKGWTAAGQTQDQLDLTLLDYKWDLTPGDTLSRKERMDRFGGGKQGGIEGSAKTPNVFVYSDPEKGGLFGYNYDGWSDSQDVFFYTGEGQVGDQQTKGGNRALLNHLSDGRKVRLFVADGYKSGTVEKVQKYIGEFRVDPTTPYTRADAPDIEGQTRSVIVFRLLPQGESLHREEDRSPTGQSLLHSTAKYEKTDSTLPEAIAAAVAAESVNSSFFKKSGTLDSVGVRREAQLVARFEASLRATGHSVGRYRLRPRGELRDLYTDTFDHTANRLYEAKASANRDAVRMALGQLLDYSRHIPREPELAVLLPSEPTKDLQLLLSSHGVICVYEAAVGSFATCNP